MCSCKNKVKKSTTTKTNNRLRNINRKTVNKGGNFLKFVSPKSVVNKATTNQPIKLNQGGTTVERANVVTSTKIKLK